MQLDVKDFKASSHLALHGPHHLLGVCHGVGLSRKVFLSQQAPLLRREVTLAPRERLAADEAPVAPQSLRSRQGLPADVSQGFRQGLGLGVGVG